ncbi:MAG TPA: tryptophan synthase subunit alpha [Chloroflexi bacterium]|nr:tryptophan synthase subunit alpha [Chloroflexota bacterium]
MHRIQRTFQTLKAQHRTALMPYLTMGFPSFESTLTLVPRLVEAGADLIELGVPFSDPLADGATIQAASQRALENGMTVRQCLSQVTALRSQGIDAPLVLMGYLNPFLAFGLSEFAAAAAAAGVDGLIIPDLPPEEADEAQAVFDAVGLDLIFLLAPSSSPARIRMVTERSRSFIYLVSLMGVTGARGHLAPGLEAFVHRVRAATDNPLAVGFGISTPTQAAEVARLADGVIVGSALLQNIKAAPDAEEAAYAFIRALREGIDRVAGA